MSPTNTMTKSQSSSTGPRGSRAKPSRLVILRLPSNRLSAFASPSTTLKPEDSTPVVPSATPPSTSDESPPVPEVRPPSPSDAKIENTSYVKAETPSTGEPDASAKTAVAAPTVKRRGNTGPRAGTKRSFGTMTADGLPKPRAKPGPKKRMRV